MPFLDVVAFAAVTLRAERAGFAERRARPYTEALEVLAAENDVEIQAE